MSDEITPAMTAKEWEQQRIEWEANGSFYFAERYTERQTPMDTFTVGVSETRRHDSMRARSHGIAALALYQQPFGFTHEDVRRIREAIIRETWENIPDVDETAALHRIADRIAALLPPEK